ncbi:MAG: SGNH/GDSL hydrolase family protein [bacterium]
MNWETLMCFGDSITIGARSYCGYPEYACDYLESELGNKWNVINQAKSGYTAMDLHRDISNNFSNLSAFTPSIVTVLIGTNDIKNNTSEQDFKIAYNQVIIKAKLIAMKQNVLMIKIPHLPVKVMYPYNFKMNEKITEFNDLLSALAIDHNVRITDFSISEEDLFDGVHLNNTGSRNFGRQLAQYILLDKGIDKVLEAGNDNKNL